ncbi:hypothetical protein GUJ93_ZPchr0010g7946 [Zizania palustris]|uniref:DUF7597 domain-containing protein n=1 Tax=Zizania palustris TaxID=103762 RepID=A0A8J5WI03_ZIZPA|nr:hypothetical protein GUJ93_ZPchr0010g7946 [Zizania palustris]
MANFPANPLLFLPCGGGIDDGGGALRLQHNTVAVSEDYMRLHEEFTIAESDDALDEGERAELLHSISNHLAHLLHLRIAHFGLYPFDVGIFQMDSVFDRDFLFSSSPYFIDGHLIQFVRHDEVLNLHQSAFARAGVLNLVVLILDMDDQMPQSPILEANPTQQPASPNALQALAALGPLVPALPTIITMDDNNMQLLGPSENQIAQLNS